MRDGDMPRMKPRTLGQNARLHAMFDDVAAQAKFNGRQITAKQWKVLFVSGHAIATEKEVDMVIGLEGELLDLRESTATMSSARTASLIEYVHAWAANNGVRFKHD